MKISFSTLGCPEWTLPQAIDLGVRAGYQGIELRFIEGEDSLWKLPTFSGSGLRQTRRCIEESGLSICCVDTSCRFDSAEASERDRWIEEGVRMAKVARELGAPGIRVFGDRIQSDFERGTTQKWIVDSLNVLTEKLEGGVEVWLETHGDFSCVADVQSILNDCPDVRLVWDSASAFIECGERPLTNGTALKQSIRHVHIKDLRRIGESWRTVLTGDGEFPLLEVRDVTDAINHTGFLSFEWEKRWHPEIEPPEVAIPHFAKWFESRWKNLDSNLHSNQHSIGARS
jgi:sugar phosphate isomerase/epimerase